MVEGLWAGTGTRGAVASAEAVQDNNGQIDIHNEDPKFSNVDGVYSML